MGPLLHSRDLLYHGKHSNLKNRWDNRANLRFLGGMDELYHPFPRTYGDKTHRFRSTVKEHLNLLAIEIPQNFNTRRSDKLNSPKSPFKMAEI